MVDKKLIRHLKTDTQKALRLILDEFISARELFKFYIGSFKHWYNLSGDSGDEEAAVNALRWMRKVAPRLNAAMEQVEEDLANMPETRADVSGSNVKFGDVELADDFEMSSQELKEELDRRRELLLTLVSRYGDDKISADLKAILDAKKKVPEADLKSWSQNHPEEFEEQKAHFDEAAAKGKKDEESLIQWLLSTEVLLKSVLKYDKAVSRMLAG